MSDPGDHNLPGHEPAVEMVLLAAPRSFCAGVEMAIKALAWMVRLCPPPVYCYHQIVHNRLVVQRFQQAGVIFVESLDEVPDGAAVMLSAHGSAPEVAAAAGARGALVVDAVCPLVSKVHHELKLRAAQGYTVIYAGHGQHDEAIAAMAVAPESIRLVEGPSDVAALDDIEGPVAFLAQTTIVADEWTATHELLRRRFTQVWTPGRSDLCYATTNRQAALRKIAARADAVVVVGSANSSNTVALQRRAQSSGCARVVRVDTAEQLPRGLAGIVGVTAGASTPEEVVDDVIACLAPRWGIEVVTTTTEVEYFPPPPALRAMMRSMGREDPLVHDRATRASDVLRALNAPQLLPAAPKTVGENRGRHVALST
jgi:4-hydroxy-3-methylbut-2-enyl diphosphate reductase